MDESLHEIRQSRAEQFEIIFFCVLAGWCFCLGIYYWIRLAGLFPGENWRFDLMGWQWRSLSASLAVLYPVAACGLWLQSRWGFILWLASAGAEIFCYLFLEHLFSLNVWLALLHFLLALLYGVIFVYRQRLAQAKEEPILAEY